VSLLLRCFPFLGGLQCCCLLQITGETTHHTLCMYKPGQGTNCSMHSN
jgi:hypothetical protein